MVFKIDPTGKETVLYSFAGGTDGGVSEFPLLQDSSGNLYGTSGVGAGSGETVFKLDTNGYLWVVMSLYRTHCRNTGIGAEMLWVACALLPATELLTLVESKTCGFHEVGMENAIPIGTRLSMCRRTLAR